MIREPAVGEHRHTIHGVRIFQDENGKYGLETYGWEWWITGYEGGDYGELNASPISEHRDIRAELVRPVYDSIECISDNPVISLGERANCYYRARVRGKAGLLHVRVSSSGEVHNCQVLPVNYDKVAVTRSLIWTRRGRKFEVYKYTMDVRNYWPYSSKRLCAARSRDKLVSKTERLETWRRPGEDELRHVWKELGS